ncbi:unnamed protein product [Fraxinus pennsylvanica]|uniref:Response regulatory domain-containing protein n=1 Tax=Fraxinus pennsylvanica TaxID=56036 RepID=A0AAD2A8I8_9LAMI|nr:unnamed protein product [Fraxinus pennsylvanica]
MPCLSGTGLLCKVMSHRTRRNISVIMMSSHDSTGLVFKCLSRGAVDFLLKPIHKNELKNLWQHIWRRCHSSSGSGSGTGTRTKSKSHDNSGNSGSDDGSCYFCLFSDAECGAVQIISHPHPQEDNLTPAPFPEPMEVGTGISLWVTFPV